MKNFDLITSNNLYSRNNFHKVYRNRYIVVRYIFKYGLHNILVFNADKSFKEDEKNSTYVCTS